MGALNPFLSLLPIPRTELRFTQWSKGPCMLLLLHMDSCIRIQNSVLFALQQPAPLLGPQQGRESSPVAPASYRHRLWQHLAHSSPCRFVSPKTLSSRRESCLIHLWRLSKMSKSRMRTIEADKSELEPQICTFVAVALK